MHFKVKLEKGLSTIKSSGHKSRTGLYFLLDKC